jgi:hypothetical protein
MTHLQKLTLLLVLQNSVTTPLTKFKQALFGQNIVDTIEL